MMPIEIRSKMSCLIWYSLCLRPEHCKLLMDTNELTLKERSRFKNLEKKISELQSGFDQDESNLLGQIMKEYETRHLTYAGMTPIGAIKVRLEELQLKPRNLSQELYGRPRVTEIFQGKRNLSLSMIRNLAEKLTIPVEVLIKEK